MSRVLRGRIVALLSLVVFSFVSVFGSGSAANAAGDKTVVIHYHRYAADYTPWNLWLWGFTTKANSGGGNAYQFNGDDAFGKVATVTVPGTAAYDSVGFIVRTDSWLKDTQADRFITSFTNDRAEIWLVEGDATIYQTAPDLTPKFRSASFDDFNHISVSLTSVITPVSGDNGFTLTGPDGDVPITSVVVTKGSAPTLNVTLTTASNIKLGKEYTLSSNTYGSTSVAAGGILGSNQFNDMYYYDGVLGAVYSPASTSFRVWAPTATDVKLVTYSNQADANAAVQGSGVAAARGTVTDMQSSDKGTWIATLNGDQNGTIYTYRATVNGTTNETIDPYARASTINGLAGVIVDLSKTDPSGFSTEVIPNFSGKPTDSFIYELHVRDLSMDQNSGISLANRGKYLAFTENNTTTPDKKTKTGISAIKDLGVSHVELMPVYDFSSVDEADTSNTQFNWGYDPQNYNIPEGSYSSDPSNPTARISELKSAVQALHANGLRTMMDVVYNHVASVNDFSFEKLVPGYYFRYNNDGSLANGSGCGNEVASDHAMVRKYIVDSVKYWATQYHIDGFRFDLMGLMDVTTMSQIRQTLDAIDPKILIIGEGWKNMTAILPAAQQASQNNIAQLPGIAVFNDGIRDGIKGSVFNATDKGFAQGNTSKQLPVMSGIVGNTNYGGGFGGSWGSIQPVQSVSYVEAHDNLTLFDKLEKSMVGSTAAAKMKAFRLASSIAILAQGVPFMQAGQEFMRSKNGNDNSYMASDEVNSIKWQSRSTNSSMVNYFKGLISLRKNHPAFRIPTATEISTNLNFSVAPGAVIAYSINGKNVGDSWRTIFVSHNPGNKAATVKLPSKSTWYQVVKENLAGVKTLATLKNATKVSVPAGSTVVFYRK